MSNELTTQQGGQVSVIAMMDKAVQSGVDVAQLERLMDLHERMIDRDAKAQYLQAMAKFQSICPSVKRTRTVKNRDNTVRYKYAPLDEIMSTIKTPAEECGLSYSFTNEHQENGLLTICTVRHTGGHSEQSSFLVPRYDGHGTNVAQDFGSASTFGKRYALSNAFGITIADDDDGSSAAVSNNSMLIYHNALAAKYLPMIVALKEAIEMEDVSVAAEYAAPFTRKDWSVLWIAPSKGGLWTSQERKFMRENQEFKDKIHEIRTSSGWYNKPENKV